MVLDVELAEYARTKEQLLAAHEGKYVLIQSSALIGVFETAEAAYGNGVQNFGRTPFLVKKIAAADQAYVNHALAQGLINARI